MKLHFKWLLISLSVSAFLVLGGSGCKNTAHGVGQDVEKVGEKIQEKTN
jgi:Entericidin EcnA/B family.